MPDLTVANGLAARVQQLTIELARTGEALAAELDRIHKQAAAMPDRTLDALADAGALAALADQAEAWKRLQDQIKP